MIMSLLWQENPWPRDTGPCARIRDRIYETVYLVSESRPYPIGDRARLEEVYRAGVSPMVPACIQAEEVEVPDRRAATCELHPG